MGEMTREAAFPMPTAIMENRAMLMAAAVSVEPVRPKDACPARRDAKAGIVQHRTR